jgi:AcrR family transcriptional regulator
MLRHRRSERIFRENLRSGKTLLDILKPRPKRDANATRERILVAARRLFGEHGYSATGIRDIAEAADVSLPLLSRYFGSKSGLFEVALRNALASRAFIEVPRPEFGRNLARLIIDADPAEVPMAIAVLAAADPEAREIATRVVEEQIVEPLGAWIGGPDGRERAVAIAMLGAGFVTHLHLLPMLDRQTLQPNDAIVRWFSTACQQVVNQTIDC